MKNTFILEDEIFNVESIQSIRYLKENTHLLIVLHSGRKLNINGELKTEKFIAYFLKNNRHNISAEFVKYLDKVFE